MTIIQINNDYSHHSWPAIWKYDGSFWISGIGLLPLWSNNCFLRCRLLLWCWLFRGIHPLRKTIPSNCYYLKSNSYCPDPTFFARLGTTYLNSQGCFYYNSTNTIIDEVSLSTRQVTEIVNQQLSVTLASVIMGLWRHQTVQNGQATCKVIYCKLEAAPISIWLVAVATA